MIIYGIKNCDTMKKAFDWLNAHNIAYSFYDYKKESITKEKIEEWLKHFSINELINTKGTTFKKLPEADKVSIAHKDKAIKLMLANTSMIKRPLVETNAGILLGFKPDEWNSKLI